MGNPHPPTKQARFGNFPGTNEAARTTGFVFEAVYSYLGTYVRGVRLRAETDDTSELNW